MTKDRFPIMRARPLPIALGPGFRGSGPPWTRGATRGRHREHTPGLTCSIACLANVRVVIKASDCVVKKFINIDKYWCYEWVGE
jgi:hypothetical protein